MEKSQAQKRAGANFSEHSKVTKPGTFPAGGEGPPKTTLAWWPFVFVLGGVEGLAHPPRRQALALPWGSTVRVDTQRQEEPEKG